MSLTEELEEQAIDRLLGELGIQLPAVELDLDGDSPIGSILSQDLDRSLQIEELREWWPFPFS
jgi:hypothetical protein